MPLYLPEISSISAGTTAATGPTVVFSNSNNVSFALNSISLAASIASKTVLGAVAAGSQTATSGTVIFSNSNNFTFGMSNSTQITASLLAAFGIQSIADSANTITSGEVVLSNSNNVSFGVSGQTITASVSSNLMSTWPLRDEIGWTVTTIYLGSTGNTGGSSQTTASFYVTPVVLVKGAVFNQIRVGNYIGTQESATNNVGSLTMAILLGIYTLNGGTRLDAMSTIAANLLISQNSSNNETYYSYLGTNSSANVVTSNAGAGVWQNLNAGGTPAQGVKNMTLYSGPLTTLSAGDYWFALAQTTKTAGQSMWTQGSTGFSAAIIAGGLNTTSPTYFVEGIQGPPERFLGIFSTATNDVINDVSVLMPTQLATANITNTSPATTDATSLWLRSWIQLASR